MQLPTNHFRTFSENLISRHSRPCATFEITNPLPYSSTLKSFSFSSITTPTITSKLPYQQKSRTYPLSHNQSSNTMHAKINIITFAVAVFVSVELSSARSFSKRDLPVTSNDQDTAGNVEDATSTPYSNYTSYADTTDQRYPNGELSILFFFSTQKHITTVCDLKWFLFIFFHKKKNSRHTEIQYTHCSQKGRRVG